MAYNGVPYEVTYKGALYRLRTGGGLGATGENDFTIIKKVNSTDTRELRYSGGNFFLEVSLLWGFARGVKVDLPALPLDEESAVLLFAAMSRDGGTLSDEYKRLVVDGNVPDLVKQIIKGPAPGAEQKQLTAKTNRVAALLNWKGEQLLRVPPDKEVARVTFRMCTPAKGFSVGGIPYKDVPRDLVERFSQDLHVELMQMFPGAIVDTQVVDEADPHCGHPIVLNKLGAPLDEHEMSIDMLAMNLWRGYYQKHQQGQQES